MTKVLKNAYYMEGLIEIIFQLSEQPLRNKFRDSV